ncbi:MAG: cation diffusion facilitator family transporter [Halieaceae bacterium]|jgi:ferrous-iron efflux pump FieF|nr:cation diffusion facilitator family transporter [Halieaceae bacterium]
MNICALELETVPSIPDRQRDERLLKLAANASVATALLLMVVKLIAWQITGSVGLLASLIDSVMDGCASLLNWVAIRYSLMPPDSDHRFGHGKAEPLAALVQSGFIGGSALFLMVHSFRRLFDPLPIEQISVGIYVMAFSMVITIILVTFQRFVMKRVASTTIEADSLHYITDLVTNAMVLLALLLATIGLTQFDAICGIAIGIYIILCGYKIGRKSIDMLMDRELSDDEKEHIYRAIFRRDRVAGVHDLRTRRSGQNTFIQLHIELDGQLPLVIAHDVAEDIELELSDMFNGADVVIHQDPSGVVDETLHDRRTPSDYA